MSTDEPWTIRRLLDWTKTFLAGRGVESPRLEAELLLAHALGCSRTDLYTRYAEEPGEAQRTAFRELVKQRAAGKPVAHLLGRKEFYSLELEVSPAVLVPRGDSEWLVTEAEALGKAMDAPTILDVGTGSGCLAIALAVRLKSASVSAIDVSEEALAVARRNAEKHKVADRVRFLHGDLFAPLADDDRFDLIVSNPPYVTTAALAALAPEVRDQEPRLALDGGPDGFAVIDRLIAEAGTRLKPAGYLLCEVGHDQMAEAKARFERGGWAVDRTVQDNGGHLRVLRARLARP